MARCKNNAICLQARLITWIKQFTACSVFARESPSRPDRLNGFHEHVDQVSQYVERIGFEEEPNRRAFYRLEKMIGFVLQRPLEHVHEDERNGGKRQFTFPDEVPGIFLVPGGKFRGKDTLLKPSHQTGTKFGKQLTCRPFRFFERRSSCGTSVRWAISVSSIVYNSTIMTINRCVTPDNRVELACAGALRK